MIRSLRLSYSPSRPFSAGASLMGMLLMLLTLLAVLLMAIFSKGRIYWDEVNFLSSADLPLPFASRCNATLIYPGQLVDGSQNTNFNWVALNGFAYSNEPMKPCTLRNQTSGLSIAPPVFSPKIYLTNFIVDCVVSSGTNASFSALSLNSLNVDIFPKLLNLTAQLPNTLPPVVGIGGTDLTFNPIDFPFQGLDYTFSEDQDYAVFMGNQSATQLRDRSGLDAVIHAVVSAVMEDFVVSLDTEFALANPLPGVLYPCTVRRKVWAPTWSIVVECYTVLAATFSPALALITFALLRAPGSVVNQGVDDEAFPRPRTANEAEGKSSTISDADPEDKFSAFVRKARAEPMRD